ncbi:MAG TPA: DivIVA domain-containing protein [Acidimicrobiales bacterium]|nr:DivIVA domain-containing protein [Acidimicrobiales bacterium]
MGPDASLTPELIQAQTFTTAFRGYDAAEVKAFQTRVANELRAWRERAEGLESAWHSAEERAARPPVLDEDTLMAAVGEETAAILRTARAAAAEMRAKAAEESERSLSDARAEAERTLGDAREEAERTLNDARAEADRVLAEALTEASQVRDDAQAALDAATSAAEEAAAGLLAAARQEASELLERAATDAEAIQAQAEKERQLTIEGANSTRDRILEDLGRRRRVATVQIEQLRAGRERLIESYAIVRRTLEEVQSELSRADAEARAAADDVGRRLKDEPRVELTEASRPLAELLDTAPPEAEAEGDAEPKAETEPEREIPAGAAQPPADEVESHEGEGEEEPTEPAGSAVDELFARIRATRGSAPADDRPEGPEGEHTGGTEEPEEQSPAEAVTEAVTEVEADAATEPAGATEPQPESPPPAPSHGGRRSGRKKASSAAAAANGHEPAAPAPAAAVRSRATVRVIQPEAGEEEATEAPVPDGDESLLQAREYAVVDLEVSLTRRLKRALQDEQNDVLDRLRNLKGAPSAERLLPHMEAQVGSYSGAARALLGEAASAGAVFTDETLGLPGRDAPVEVDVSDLAEECGNGIVAPLRRRLEQAIDLGAGDDQAVLVESLGAAYREWKTQRIERLAGDVLSAAFSRGTWQAAPAGANLRWVVEDADGPCPDCDDDALAGDIPKGEAFPTGQLYPPAHSGCRCLLVPSLPES